MQPEIDVFGLSIKTFGLTFALGFLAAGAIVGRRLREQGRPVDWAYEIAFASLVGGVVGAKVYYAIEHLGDGGLFSNLFSGVGLVWNGGAIGGALAVLLWAWRRGVLDLHTVDVTAVPLAVGYAIGRIGCQVSGDGDYGIPWNGPWAMAYPNGTVPTDTPVHPTPIYETLAMGLVAWGLWQLRDRVRPGVLFAIYLVSAGLERFLVEFIRRNADVVAGLTAPQLESLVMIAGGAVWLWALARRGPLRAARAPRRRVPATA